MKINRLHSVPGFPVAVEDTVGAGDAFSAAFLMVITVDGRSYSAARFANALGSIVASRAGATPALVGPGVLCHRVHFYRKLRTR